MGTQKLSNTMVSAAKRGRDAVLLPHLPMKFREALGDYLKVQPDQKETKSTKKRTRKSKRKERQ